MGENSDPTDERPDQAKISSAQNGNKKQNKRKFSLKILRFSFCTVLYIFPDFLSELMFFFFFRYKYIIFCIERWKERKSIMIFIKSLWHKTSNWLEQTLPVLISSYYFSHLDVLIDV